MRVTVANFKSISELDMKLEDLTILIGPPSSGKSNILEALATMGYTIKTLIDPYIEGYSIKDKIYIGNINKYIRGVVCRDLINKFYGRNSAVIEVDYNISRVVCGDDPNVVQISLALQDSILHKIKARIARPDLAAKLDLENVGTSDINSERSIISLILSLLLNLDNISVITDPFKVEESKVVRIPPGRISVVVPRLYGFDRLHAINNIIRGKTGALYPVSYLEESALNLSRILYVNTGIQEDINTILEDFSGVRVMPLSDGRLAFIDRNKEVGPTSISDTVLRMLYGYTALLASKPKTITIEKIMALDENEKTQVPITLEIVPLIMLEEPEAHMYPAAFYNLAEAVAESISIGNKVMITTHSGRLAQILWDHILKKRYRAIVYYVHRGEDGNTRAYKVNMKLLAEYIEDLDLIVNEPPDKIDQMLKDGILVS
ncbi:MAG: AAA family ATPase [Desulfurococcales archaeon]|nr:AAA family ATPase [Desulfurococcales archaeon]